MQGTWVQSLVGKLRSHTPHATGQLNPCTATKDVPTRTRCSLNKLINLKKIEYGEHNAMWLSKLVISISFSGTLYYHVRYHENKEVKVLVAHSCPALCDPMDCSPPGSSVPGIVQARILEWVAIPFSRGSSWPRDQTCGFHIAGRLLSKLPRKLHKTSCQSGSVPPELSPASSHPCQGTRSMSETSHGFPLPSLLPSKSSSPLRLPTDPGPTR